MLMRWPGRVGLHATGCWVPLLVLIFIKCLHFILFLEKEFQVDILPPLPPSPLKVLLHYSLAFTIVLEKFTLCLTV